MSSSDEDFVPISQLLKKKTTVDPDRNDFEDDSDADDIPLSALTKKKTTTVSKKKTPTKTKVRAETTKTKKKRVVSTASKSAKKSPKATKKSPKKDQKKVPHKAKAPKAKKKKATTTTTAAVRKLKVHGKVDRLDMAIKAYRWWTADELPDNIAWRKLEHNGVLFPPSYERHDVPLVYDGNPITNLTLEQEELATHYASMPPDGPQLGNPVTAKIFRANFFKDFRQSLGPKHVIQDFARCDFSQISTHLLEQRELKKSLSKEERAPEKELRAKEQFQHGFSLVDGHLEKVGNFRIEPPGLFRGRGEHPKTGTFKRRVRPEDVTLNAGMADRVPPCLMPGHAWKEVIHRDSVTWLAYWNENVMGGTKYVWLAASSSFKGKSDQQKYEKARRLKNCIERIRKDYIAGLDSKDMLIRQRSTAMWVIDVLALRVGNEKGEDEADTVGCCSLRVEHMSFEEVEEKTSHEEQKNNNNEAFMVTLSFLGKDSMPYHNVLNLGQYGAVGKKIFRNLQLFCKKKQPHQDVFNELTPTELNKHLGSLMPGLSAKVFRTYNASHTLQQELPQDKTLKDSDSATKTILYNDANRKVAILCNHQRTVTKSFEATLEKMNLQLAQLEAQKAELQSMLKLVKKGKDVRLKKEHVDDKEDKKAQSHLFLRSPSEEQVKKKLEMWDKKIKALGIRVRDKDDNKEVALGTSKINYMDPRITVAWCKRVRVGGVLLMILRMSF